MVKNRNYELEKERAEQKVKIYEDLSERDLDLRAETALSIAESYLSLKEPRKARHYFEMAADLFHHKEGPDSKLPAG